MSRIIISTLTVLYFSVYVRAEMKYLTLGLHGESSCSESSLLSKYIFPLPSLCNTLPFGDYYVKYSNEDDNTVNYLVYEDSECMGSPNNETSTTFFTNESICYELFRNYRTFYINFTMSEYLPFDKDDSKKYSVAEHFSDNDCQIPIDGTVDNAKTVIIRTLELDLLGEFIKYDSAFYCSDDWGFVEEVYNQSYTGIVSWKHLPQSRNRQCVPNYNESIPMQWYYPIDAYRSMKVSCMEDSEVETTYFDSAPESSQSKYELLTYHYDSNCSRDFYIKPWYTEVCNHRRTIYRTINDGMVDITYYNSDCTGDIYRYQIQKSRVNGPNFFEGCDYLEQDELFEDISTYIQRIKSDQIHFPEHLAIIHTRRANCSEDISVVKKDPSDVDFFSFLTQEKCLTDEEIGFPPGLLQGQSFEGKCSDGHIKLIEYLDAEKCYGYSIESDQQFCVSQGGNGYFDHYTCFGYFCGEYDEWETDQVCTGRGDCIGKDQCECHKGFQGVDCETWSCDGIDYKNEDEVCHGHGECLSFDRCVCDTSWFGEFCDTSGVLNFFIIFTSVLLPTTSFFVLVFVLVALACCCCLICIILCLSCFLICIASISYFQKRRLGRFNKLENLDLLLEEQNLQRDHSIAHLRINKNLFEIPFEEIKLEKVLAEGGSSSVVYKSKWKNVVTAFKCFKTRVICSNQECFDEFETEVQIMSSVNHPHILQFLGCSIKPPRIGILMEYCSNGDLRFFLKNYKLTNPDTQSYAYPEKIRMIFEISQGLEYLHSRSIIHRDLKCENVLVDNKHTCKIMDFGLSKIVVEMASAKTKKIGTSNYMAPELILDSRYDEKVDVFSFGILMYIVFSEDFFPYGHEESNVEIQVAMNPNYRPSLEKLTKLLTDQLNSVLPEGDEEEDSVEMGEKIGWICGTISLAWDHDPLKRPSFEELVSLLDVKTKMFFDEDSKILKQSEERRLTVQEIMRSTSINKRNRKMKEENDPIIEDDLNNRVESIEKKETKLEEKRKSTRESMLSLYGLNEELSNRITGLISENKKQRTELMEMKMKMKMKMKRYDIMRKLMKKDLFGRILTVKGGDEEEEEFEKKKEKAVEKIDQMIEEELKKDEDDFEFF